MVDTSFRFEQACGLLPLKWQMAAQELPNCVKSGAEELRLRNGRPMTVLYEGKELYTHTADVVTANDMEQLCDILSGYSRYAAYQSMAQGFLCAPGGFRVGLCGTAVMDGRQCTNLRDISSACIRIGREVVGISDGVLPQLFAEGVFCNTLLLSGPGGGKTTLLRDLVRNLSTGAKGRRSLRIGLVDERGEVAGMYSGVPQFDVGRHTDVMDACPKAHAAEMLLRTMNPQVIALDEITAQGDLYAMENACNCGVGLLATIHGRDLSELRAKPLFRRLLKMHVFERVVIIRHAGANRTYQVEAAP